MDINSTGQPPGTLKYVDTPVGKFEIPQGIAEALGRMSDIELMREYVEKCRNFIDPFLFQEMADRGLIRRGDYHRDIEARLREMEQVLLDGINGNGGLTNMDIYNEKGFADRNEYLKDLAKQYNLNMGNVRIWAHMLGPDADFTDLLKLCEQKRTELANAPDPYRARGYNNKADYFSELASEYALPVEMIEKMASELEPADHFDGLLSQLQEEHDDVYGKMYDETEDDLENEDDGLEL